MNKVRGQIVKEPVHRLMELSIPEPNSGCWIWLGSTRGPSPHRQYGRLVVGSRVDGSRRSMSAHRYAYEVFNSANVPSALEVCHRCDNPLCINPEHLWVGTKQDNTNDRERKGRNKLAYGERNGQAKLTHDQVAEIRSSQLGCLKLSRIYRVDKKTIQRVRNGTQWAAALNQEGHGDG